MKIRGEFELNVGSKNRKIRYTEEQQSKLQNIANKIKVEKPGEKQ